MTRPATRQARERDSWGGRAVILLATSVVAGAFVGRVFDGAVRIQEMNGQVYWQTTSNKGGVLAILLMGCAAACAVLAIHRNPYRTSLGVGFLGLMFALIAWWLSVSYTHLRAHETRHDLVCRL